MAPHFVSKAQVFVLQITGNLVVGSGASVTLTGGARAANIFWVVAGLVNVGANAHMEGTILCKTSITFESKSSLRGRIMAQTNVDLQMVTIVQDKVVSPTPPPSVILPVSVVLTFQRNLTVEEIDNYVTVACPDALAALGISQTYCEMRALSSVASTSQSRVLFDTKCAQTSLAKHARTLYTCTHAHFAHMHTHALCTPTYTHAHIHIHIHIHAHAHTRLFTFKHIHAHRYTHAHTSTQKYTHTHA
jgi:hypothetical protein